MTGSIAAHALSASEACEQLGVSASKGLSASEAKLLLEEHGPNELEKEDPTPLWKLVLDQFDDYLVKILLLSAVFSLAASLIESGHDVTFETFVEPGVILLILIINAIVGVWQESNAESALEALKDMQSPHARCLRDGVVIPELPATELVPGDIVFVKVGDRVPADLRVLKLETTALNIDQAALTGESSTVAKRADHVADEEADITSKKNMLFASTTVATGAAKALVVSTGMNTEIGNIQKAVTQAKDEEEKTPLGKKIDSFGESLANVILAICILVWVMNWREFFDADGTFDLTNCVYYLKIAVALGVAAIPEGLPAVITLCLALGTRQMVKRNAIVRKLPSVETLGCTTVICSDKTGTLTTNEMVVERFAYPVGNEMLVHDVDGTSYEPTGDIIDWEGMDESNAVLVDLARTCALCNDAEIRFMEGRFKRLGEPTEAALKVLVEKMGHAGVDRSSLGQEDRCREANQYWASQYARVAVLEFDRDRKSMSVIVRSEETGGNRLLVKGAPESVLARCTRVRFPDGKVAALTEEMRGRIREQVDGMAESALRCLAMATRDDLGPLADYDGSDHPAHDLVDAPDKFSAVESDLVFVGITGIRDPPRPEVHGAIEDCTSAGIRVIVITGDNKLTAESIARDIGVFAEDEDISEKSFTGLEFFKLPEERQRAVLAGDGSRVFSRAEPRHKQDLVRLLRKAGHVVAMTGDGVNDAPALKLADIGIAMGISGTEVAKEASDMVLADDNFATIVAAVEEGRAIYQNMQAFIRYLISSNIGEVASIFITAAFGLPEALNPVQLLWVNLVTDGPPATALGFNPPDPDIMQRRPRRSDDSLITGWVFFRYMVVGMYVGFATVGIFAYWYVFNTVEANQVPLDRLMKWGECTKDNYHTYFTSGNPVDFQVPFSGETISIAQDPCSFFGTNGKVIASTLALSVLVTIEMLNALNALSEDGSLISIPPWRNPWLLLAMAVSFGLHFVIMYIPAFARIFGIAPLDLNEWKLVFAFSIPVVILDEILKFVGRIIHSKPNKGAAVVAGDKQKQD